MLFAGDMEWGAILLLALNSWLFKLMVALVDTPVVYAAVWWFKRYAPTEELFAHRD